MYLCLRQVLYALSCLRMKTFVYSALFILLLGNCCETSEKSVVKRLRKLSATTRNETPRLPSIFKDITEKGQLPRLHAKDIISRFKRTSNPCPSYEWPMHGNCEPCICTKGEQPKENCGYGLDGAVSDACEPCGDGYFSRDGRINGCEVCTDCGQRGFLTTCSNSTDATCACEEGQKLDNTGQCLPVCCKCSDPRDTNNEEACRLAFGSAAIEGGYLCSDSAILAQQPCQDYQPPTTPHPAPDPTTNPTTTVSVTNKSTPAVTTSSSGNKTPAPTAVKPTATLPDGTTQAQPTPSGEPSHDEGHQNHLQLFLGLGGLGLFLITVLALVGVGCKRKKIYQKIKCMKKCWERKPPPDLADAALLNEDPDQSDAPEETEVLPDVPPDPDHYEETGETGGQGAGKPDDAVPIPAGEDGSPTPEGAEGGEAGDDSDDKTVPKDVVSGDSGTLLPPGLKDDDDDESETEFPERTDGGGATSDTFPEFIQRMPLEAILNEKDLFDDLRIKLEEFKRHFRNIGSHFGVTDDELNHIEFTELRGKDSPLKAILEKITNETNENATVGELLQYCDDKLKRRDVVKMIVEYFEQREQDNHKMEAKEGVTSGVANSQSQQLEECSERDNVVSEMKELEEQSTSTDDVRKESMSEQSTAQEKLGTCDVNRDAYELVEMHSCQC